MVLNNWALSHIENPYPCVETKSILAAQSNLTQTQIDNWFKMFRHRQLKKTPKTVFALKD